MTQRSSGIVNRLSALKWLGLFVLLAFLGGGVLGFMDGSGQPVPDIVRITVLGLVLVGGVWVSVVYWLRLDEAAKEAHKFAWYWGGSTGLLIAGIAALTFFGDSAAAPLWPGFDPSPANYLLTGALGVVGAQIIGYLVVWAGWWAWNSRS